MHNASVRRALATAVLLVLTACGTAAGTGQSGLRGVVMRSPITPVCQVGVPCSAPAKNTPLIFSRIGHQSVSTRTDGYGHYRVALAPGRWNVRTTRTGIGSGVRPSVVTVVAGTFRRVNLSIDTGIR